MGVVYKGGVGGGRKRSRRIGEEGGNFWKDGGRDSCIILLGI